ncbi:MAG: terminase small subunit, partial [Candidatus Thiodiazotropha endolucinida]
RRAEAFERLTTKQQQFVLEYPKDFNGAQAAIRAGYSENSARQIAAENLAKPDIQKASSEQVVELQRRAKVDAEYLLTILKEDVEADIADLFKDNGNLKPVEDWPPAFRRGLVASLKIKVVRARGDDEESQIVRIKEVRLADRTKLKELLGRHKAVGAFEKDEQGSDIHIHLGEKEALL